MPFEIRPETGAGSTSLRLRNQVERRLPGPSGKMRMVCVLELEAAVPDLLICPVSDVDLFMGPLPSVRRTMTGDDRFDKVYAIFMSAAEQAEPAGFRESAPSPARVWSDSEVRAGLLDLRAFWLRVGDGRLEVAFEPLFVSAALRPLRLAARLDRALRGSRHIEASLAELKLPETAEPTLGDGLFYTWLPGFWASLFLFYPAAISRPFLAIDEDEMCGANGPLVHTKVGLLCFDNGSSPADSDMHYWASWLWCLGFTVLVGAVIFSLRSRRPSSRPPEAPAGPHLP